MGYIKHHAISVTSWDSKAIKKAHRYAKKLFSKRASSVIKSTSNSWFTFFIAPDGSKEGWPESDKGDNERTEFINWLDSQKYEDDSNVLAFCEFFYGEDNGHSKIERHN